MHGRGRHFGHGHGRRARMFEQGALRLALLKLIAEQPRHGYELIKAIEEKSGGAYSPSAGVIYPTLTLLEEQGYASSSEADGGKKVFSITPEGEAHLAENEGLVRALFARLSEAATRAGAGQSPKILRARENLRLALELKLGAGPLTDAQIAAIAAALDEAAKAVEGV
jgi:DNA-binding PadR family transcriptional regulator